MLDTLKDVWILCAARMCLIFSESPWMYGMVMYVSGFSLSGGETGWVHWRETCLISVGG